MALITRTVGNTVINELPEYVPEQQPPKKWMAVGSFFDRFGMYKLAILQSEDPLVKAIVLDSSVRKYINLENPLVAQGLGVLVAKGFEVDVQAILETPISAEELP